MLSSIRLTHLKGDVFGGITAAVVALPLALAFGVSSGAGAIAGLYGAICVGFFAALFGGTPAQVSGPTGPMTVVMAAIFTEMVALDPHAGPAIAFTVVLLGGLFQIGFGLIRIGKYLTMMPFPVISGFMSGIGVIIIILQLAPLLGYPASAGVIDSLRLLPDQILAPDWPSLTLALVTLAIVFFWPQKLAEWFPSPLAALCAGTLLGVAFFASSTPVIGVIPTGLPELYWPTFEWVLLKKMLFSALLLAALGSIDSLLTSIVADNMSREQHDSDRELIGQGVGNVIAGLLGGLPGAGATMRTVVNIRAGGQTPISGMLHSVILLALVLGAGHLAEQIPLAVLAGILMKVGIDIIDWGFLRRAHRAPLFAACLMYGVLLLTVFVDLITAVAVGVFLANLITVKRLSDLQLKELKAFTGRSDAAPLAESEQQLLETLGDDVLLYYLGGPMSFGAARGIARRLVDFPAHKILLLDCSDLSFLDVTSAMAVEDIIIHTHDAGRLLVIAGLRPELAEELTRLEILQRVPESYQLPTRHQALSSCQAWLEARV